MGSRGRRGSDEHRAFEDMAVAHVLGGLSLDDGRLFRTHLLECTSCRARVGELRAIAHDLADVERHERREKAARRTETKAREDEEEPELAPPVSQRLRTRTTLLIAAGLTVLMALSAWNFLLRGRLQEAEAQVAQLRASAGVLHNGEVWRTVATSTGSIEGLVRSRDDVLVVLVEQLAFEADYWLYVYDARDEQIHLSGAAAEDGVLYEYRVDLPAAHRVEVVRANQPTSPRTGTIVFEASREGDAPRPGQTDPNVLVDPVGE